MVGNFLGFKHMFMYETPWALPASSDCYFYHTINLPGVGCVEGDWDLRPDISAYLSHYDFKNKRVLDVGTATGFLSYYCEANGAEVVSFDFSEKHPINFVPEWNSDISYLKNMKNGYWYCHHNLKSKNRVFYGDVYDLPDAVGQFDVAVVGSILLHLENPYGALKSIAKRAKSIIVVEASRPDITTDHMVFRPYMGRQGGDYLCWWYVPFKSAKRMLNTLGYTTQPPVFLTAHGKKCGHVDLYSVIADK
jgi:SAM-dependent methyltransferase